jgi:hypothetical protein
MEYAGVRRRLTTVQKTVTILVVSHEDVDFGFIHAGVRELSPCPAAAAAVVLDRALDVRGWSSPPDSDSSSSSFSCPSPFFVVLVAGWL